MPTAAAFGCVPAGSTGSSQLPQTWLRRLLMPPVANAHDHVRGVRPISIGGFDLPLELLAAVASLNGCRLIRILSPLRRPGPPGARRPRVHHGALHAAPGCQPAGRGAGDRRPRGPRRRRARRHRRRAARPQPLGYAPTGVLDRLDPADRRWCAEAAAGAGRTGGTNPPGRGTGGADQRSWSPSNTARTGWNGVPPRYCAASRGDRQRPDAACTCTCWNRHWSGNTSTKLSEWPAALPGRNRLALAAPVRRTRNTSSAGRNGTAGRTRRDRQRQHQLQPDLRNGVAPVGEMQRHGIRLATGLDGFSIDDDDDALRELRLAYMLHRGHGLEPACRSANCCVPLARPVAKRSRRCRKRRSRTARQRTCWNWITLPSPVIR